MNCIKTEKKTIGLVTPSSPAPACFPKRFQRGVENLESMGFCIWSHFEIQVVQIGE